MTIYSGIFNSVRDGNGNGDREYNAWWFAKYFATFIGNGVFPNPSTNLQVIENTNMTVKVKPGSGWIDGYFIYSDSDHVLQLDIADGVLKRIDRIVMRLNHLTRQIEIAVKKGTFASNPVAPSLQRDTDAWELALADIRVNNGATQITQANITDTRLNTELCGIVHGVVNQVDTTTLFNQYQSWIEQQKSLYESDLATWTAEQKQDFEDWQALNENQFATWKSDFETAATNWFAQEQTDFETWFATLQDLLDENVAATLTVKVQALETNKANQEDLVNISESVDDLEQTVATHLAEKVHESEAHGLRATNGKLEYFNGTEWKTVSGGLPVGAVTNFKVKADNGKVALTWIDPSDVVLDGATISRWKGTKILRKTEGYPQMENDGVLVVDSGIRNQYQYDGFEDTGLINGIEYYYSAFSYTTEDIYSEKVDVSTIPIERKIYGIEIDESNSNPSTRVTYTDDAVGMTPMAISDYGSWENVIKEEFGINSVLLKNKVVNYYLNNENRTLKKDGSPAVLTGADGDVMTEFAKPLYLKWTTVGTVHKIQLSNKPFTGAVSHAFETENGYNLVPYYPLMLMQALFTLFYKSTDSQTALGRGFVDGNASYATSGGTNAKGMNYGEVTGKQQMAFLGIEDFWGNKLWWVDGLVSDASFNILIGKSGFNDVGTGYSSYPSGVSANLGGYADKVQGGNEKGFIIKASGGSETTHYADYGNLYSSRVAGFGGNSSYGSIAGAFHLRLTIAASNAVAAIGARLFCAAVGKFYVGAYLGTTVSGKLRSISDQTVSDTKTIGAFRTEAKANN